MNLNFNSSVWNKNANIFGCDQVIINILSSMNLLCYQIIKNDVHVFLGLQSESCRGFGARNNLRAKCFRLLAYCWILRTLKEEQSIEEKKLK
jgi:hypothetical protein